MLPRGRPPQATLFMTVDRALTPADILRLMAEPHGRAREGKVAAPVLKRLRSSHHRVAQLLAQGKTLRDTAREVGYSPQRVSDLLVDPAFKDLLAYYAGQKADTIIEDGIMLRRKHLEIADAASDEILDRLDNEAIRSKMPIGELRQLAIMGSDRSAAPPIVSQQPIATPTIVTINLPRELKPQGPIIDNEKPQDPDDDERA